MIRSGEAGAAFVAGQVDVAVTWEPWLSKAKARTGFSGLHVLLAHVRELQAVLLEDLSQEPLGHRALVDRDLLPFEILHRLHGVFGEDSVTADRGVDRKHFHRGHSV